MMPEAGFDLGTMHDSLGFLLRLAQIDAFNRFFAKGDLAALGLGEISILRGIGLNPGVRQGVLAQALRIKRAHMTKIMRVLEGRGLIRTSVPPEDRRAVTLWLTEAGQTWLQEHWPEVEAREALVPRGMAPADVEQLKHLLRKFLAAAEYDPQEEAAQ
jgi:DNA-binding MarR family transcriptional regulator